MEWGASSVQLSSPLLSQTPASSSSHPPRLSCHCFPTRQVAPLGSLPSALCSGNPRAPAQPPLLSHPTSPFPAPRPILEKECPEQPEHYFRPSCSRHGCHLVFPKLAGLLTGLSCTGQDEGSRMGPLHTPPHPGPPVGPQLPGACEMEVCPQRTRQNTRQMCASGEMADLERDCGQVKM